MKSLLRLCLSLLLLAPTMAQRTTHHFKMLTSQRVKSIMQCSDVESLQQYDFPAILKPRIPGTQGHQEVKQYILSRLSQLDCSRWNITEHSFEQDTIIGRKPFTNIIATLDPSVDRRLALVAHYDSKILEGHTFLGATDSALPVALLLDTALALDSKLKDRQLTDVSLQLIFTDGEEAFRSWTHTDSLYGARELAKEMDVAGGLLSVNGKTGIQALEAFVLLDLIGSTEPHPVFHDTYEETTNMFQKLVNIEKRLDKGGLLESHSRGYFSELTAFGRYPIEDDHKPFLARGVPILHLITYPFPAVWHTHRDDASAIDWVFVSNFRKILFVFLHEYFHLK